MSPKLTRRTALAGAVGLGATYYGARRLQRGAVDAHFASWTPAEGTWPLPRYDPANTAHSPDASPPTAAPTVERVADGTPWVPLVGTDHVALDAGPDTVVTRDHEPVWSPEADVNRVAFGPPGDDVLYVHADDSTLCAVSTDGQVRVERERETPFSFSTALLPGAEGLYVGTHDEVVAFREDLSRTWAVAGSATSLDGGGRLYVRGDGAAAYAERRGLDRRVGVGPRRTWRADVLNGWYPPAVANGRVVVTTAEGRVGDGTVRAFDAATGERLWGPLRPTANHGTPALADGRAFHAGRHDAWNAGLVGALDLDTGEWLWSAETDWNPTSAAVGGETLVVTGYREQNVGPTRGVLCAYTLDGEALWTHEMAVVPNWPALVGDRILFGADENGGTGGLYAAR